MGEQLGTVFASYRVWECYDMSDLPSYSHYVEDATMGAEVARDIVDNTPATVVSDVYVETVIKVRQYFRRKGVDYPDPNEEEVLQ